MAPSSMPHAFLTHARHFHHARTAEEKLSAVQNMLKSGTSLDHPILDEAYEKLEEELHIGLQELSDAARRVAHIVQYAHVGLRYFKTNPSLYLSVVKSLIADYIHDNAERDHFAAADLALQFLTAEMADSHPVALGATLAYADALNVCTHHGHFARVAGITNQEEALDIMRLCVTAARDAYQAQRIAHKDLLGIVGQKYIMIFQHSGQDKLDIEVYADLSDPVLAEVQRVLNEKAQFAAEFSTEQEMPVPITRNARQ